MRRYEKKSILINSNRPLEDWGKLFQDVPVATAILDRVLHHCHIVPFVGRSKRWPGSTVLPGLKLPREDQHSSRTEPSVPPAARPRTNWSSPPAPIPNPL